nr:hypothetical protein Iba_scaffold14529CG0220 [Ipomoea batatas]
MLKAASTPRFPSDIPRPRWCDGGGKASLPPWKSRFAGRLKRGANWYGADFESGAARAAPLPRRETLSVEKFAGMVPVPVAAMIAGSA